MKKSRFFDLFPPPEFLTMPAAGISLESDAVRLVSFDSKLGHHSLKIADEHRLDPDALVSGEISKSEKLLTAFENIRNEHKVRFARVAIPEEKAYVYETIIPVPEEGTLSDAVEFTMDQNIPLPASDVVFDFAVMDKPFSNNGVLSVGVVVSAYSRQTAEAWTDLLARAGITPISLVSKSQAIAHSVVARDDMRTHLVAHFLKDKTIIAVVSGGFVCFATTISNSLDDAEKILKSHEGERIAESVELLAVRDEIKKVYSYWVSKHNVKSKNEPRSISSLIVSGHVSEMADVAEYLGKHVSTPALLANVWQNAFSLDEFVPEIEFDDSLKYAAAVGMALSI